MKLTINQCRMLNAIKYEERRCRHLVLSGYGRGSRQTINSLVKLDLVRYAGLSELMPKSMPKRRYELTLAGDKLIPEAERRWNEYLDAMSKAK